MAVTKPLDDTAAESIPEPELGIPGKPKKTIKNDKLGLSSAKLRAQLASPARLNYGHP